MARATKRARSGRRQRDAGRRRRRLPVAARLRARSLASPPALRALARSSASHPDPRRAGMHGQRGDRHVDSPMPAAPLASALAVARARPSLAALAALPPRSAQGTAAAGRRRRRSTRSSSPPPRPRSRCSSSLADVTVIGADEIARAGVQSLAELLQRQPGVEIVQNGGPGAVSGVFLRGANRGQTLVLVDGLRVGSSSAGVDDAGGDSARPDRADRGPARTGVEPLRRRRHRRRDPGVHAPRRRRPDRQRQRRLRHLRHRGRHGGRRAAARDRSPSRCRRAARAATASTRSSTRRNFSYNDDRDGYTSQNVSASLDLPWADGQALSAPYLRNRLERAVRRRPRLRRPHDHRRRDLARRQPQPARAVLDVARCRPATASTTAARRPASATSPFDTTQRQYTWQNDFTLPGAPAR